MTKVRTLFGAILATSLVAFPAAAQEFGGSVLLHDGQLLVSESFDPVGTGPDGTPRTIYIYSQSGNAWEQTGTIQAPAHEGADFFGRFMIQDGEQLIVGATALDDDGDGLSDGSVLIYNKDGDDWAFDSYLRPASVPAGSSYGRFASVAGDLLVVSALGYEGTGGAWVFQRGSGGEWVEQDILVPSAPDSIQEFFGWGVHTDGERVVVGAFHGQQLPGAAYVFGRDASGNWVEEALLTLPEGEADPGAVLAGNGPPSFGVGVSGTHVLFGLPGADNGTGTVHHFERKSSGDWVSIGQLSAFDRQPGAAFGARFHDHEGDLWISAPGADQFGAIYAFTWDPDAERFGSATKINAGRGTDSGDGFGISMASAGNLAAIGQPWDDGIGSVIIMQRGGDGWEVGSKLFIPEDRRDLTALSDIECSDDGLADQFGCSQVDVLSFMPLAEIGGTDRGIQANDVWGWTDPQTGREYALVGRTDGAAFIDISNPSAPVYLGNLPKTPGSQTNAWRDIKVFDNHAYIVADGAGQHGMQVFDLAHLRDVRDAPVEFTPDALYDAFGSAHNVVINEGTGTAYAVGVNSGGETCGGGLHMIDINSPKDPTFVGCFADVGTGRSGTGYSHDAMCIDYNGPDAEHVGKEICFGSNENAISIANVTDRDNPISLATATYPAAAYTHQGWITEDHRYFYVGDELDEMASVAADTLGAGPDMEGARTLIWDVSDLDDPVLVKEHIGETFTIDHNLYIVGDLMYQSNYVSGLRVLDISDRENPVEVGYFDTVPWDESVTFDGSWSNYPFFASGTVIVSSGQEGVFFVKYRRPELVP